MSEPSTVSADLTTEPICTDEVLSRVGADEDGAVLLFLGVVRDHADGRSVEGLHYEIYEAMAREVLQEIADEAARDAGIERLHVVHRSGTLDVGETSVAIAVSSPHRAEAFQASRQVIEEIKQRLPVWKEEHYTSGRVDWVEGADPRPAAGAPSGGERP